jgi:hypothetical protein
VDVAPTVSTLNFGLLDRAFLEWFRWADQEIGVQVNKRNRAHEFRLAFGYACFEPTYDGLPRRVVGLKLVMSSDLPDAQPAIAAVGMSTTVNESAWLSRVTGGLFLSMCCGERASGNRNASHYATEYPLHSVSLSGST